jgi:lysophospholipase L1-like esterase
LSLVNVDATSGDTGMSSSTGSGSATIRRGRYGRRTAAAAFCGALALTAGAVTPAAAAPSHAERHAPAVRYVALGDSYTSGPGIPTQVDAGCGRSDHNYPSLVAAAEHAGTFTDVSCGGATTAEMWRAQGAGGPQLDALDRSTTLVTVQIGGNDMGFGSIIATCAGLAPTDPAGNPCQRYYNATGTDRITAGILDTAPRVAEVLRGVHHRAPRARVLLVGYPDLLPDDGAGCPSPVVPFAVGDFGYLSTVEKKLNAMLRVEAFLHGATYVDAYTPTIGHDMCKAPADRWVEPLVPASPAAPAHPNAKGEQAMADAVLARLAVPGRSHGH